MYLWASRSIPPEGSGGGVAICAPASKKKGVTAQVRGARDGVTSGRHPRGGCLLGFGLSDDVPAETRSAATRGAVDLWSSAGVASRRSAE